MKTGNEVVTTSLRLPKGLYRQLKIYKAKQRPLLSLNSIIVEKLQEALESEHGGDAA